MKCAKITLSITFECYTWNEWLFIHVRLQTSVTTQFWLVTKAEKTDFNLGRISYDHLSFLNRLNMDMYQNCSKRAQTAESIILESYR